MFDRCVITFSRALGDLVVLDLVCSSQVLFVLHSMEKRSDDMILFQLLNNPTMIKLDLAMNNLIRSNRNTKKKIKITPPTEKLLFWSASDHLK